MKRQFGLLLVSAVSVLVMAGCSIEGGHTGTVVGSTSRGQSEPWKNDFNRGKGFLASGYFGLALERFRAALALNPRSARILNAVAVTYERLDRDDLAELYYNKALEIEPNSAMTLNNVGYSMLKRQRYEEALIYFEQALKNKQTLADRRVTSANRKLAMNQLRVARQREAQQVVAKASLAVANDETKRIECLDQGAVSVGRTGARVFELITDPSRGAAAASPYRSGHGAQVKSDAASVSCQDGPRARVALIRTAAPKEASQVAVAERNHQESRPNRQARLVVAAPKSAPPLSARKNQPALLATGNGQPSQAPVNIVKVAPTVAAESKAAESARSDMPAQPVAGVTESKPAAKGTSATGTETSAAKGPTEQQGAPAKTATTNPIAKVGKTAMAVDKEIVVTPLLPIPVAADRPAAAVQDKKTVTVPAVHPASLIVEVSNGAGRNKLAARVRAYFERKGLPVSFLTNAESFGFQHTKIFYKSGKRSVAEDFAQQLPIPVQLIEVSGYFADIRVLLGADILNFDRNTLYAAKTGGSNA